MRNEKILVVDEDPLVHRSIWKSLQSTGIFIYQSHTIDKTLEIMSRVHFDLLVLAIDLEHENDGYQLIQLIRERDPLIPILFLYNTQANEETQLVIALELGADCGLLKPFHPNVLKAQVIALLERRQQLQSRKNESQQNEIALGDFCFDKMRYRFFKKNQQIHLSSKEMQLMQFFMEHPEQVFSKEQIYSNVWGNGSMDANTIMVFMNHLRNKIEENPKQSRYLKTIWGLGYTFNPSGE